MSTPPATFLSYATIDDHKIFNEGRLTELRERLSYEVQVLTGKTFHIFQDRNDIKLGENWRDRLNESLDSVTFLIPVITPSFFESKYCRYELERFLEREKALERRDLILPIYYVECLCLTDAAKRATDPLTEVIASRQRADWRDLRFEPFTNLQVRKILAKMATQIRDALERVQAQTVVQPSPPPAAKPESATATIESQAVQAEPTQPKALSPKTQMPTLMVDPMHRGDHTTISAAIEAAKPGTRILVCPGLYTEGIVIDKPLEIIGDGRREDIILRVKGKDVILFQTTMGRVANLTLRQNGDGKWFGVDIAQGRLDLEDCDISSRSLACVAIHDGADPRLKRNHIHDGKQGGVYVYTNGLGTLEDNDIFGNAIAGVEIKEGGNPTLRQNRIHDGQQSGVYVHTNGLGTLEDNEIFSNAIAGVSIETGSNLTLLRNRIYDSGYRAVYIHDGGGGTFEDNDLRDNARDAWYITDDCKDKVKRSGNLE